jgi:hypothetical protein
VKDTWPWKAWTTPWQAALLAFSMRWAVLLAYLQALALTRPGLGT